MGTAADVPKPRVIYKEIALWQCMLQVEYVSKLSLPRGALRYYNIYHPFFLSVILT